MRKTTGKKGQMINTLFTMLLFLVFVLCALFTVLIGGKVYENVASRTEDNYTGSVALNYVANKVRQGDMADSISVTDIEGIPVLQMKQEIEGDSYITWIYYKDGSVRELFTDTESGLTLADGLEIMKCEGMNFTQDGQLITVETTGQGGSRLMLAVRSGGVGHE